MNDQKNEIEFDASAQLMSLQSFLLMIAATAIGAFAAIVVLPYWLPELNASLQGNSPKAFWFLSRASAIVAYILLWFSMFFGLLITNKLARIWPKGPHAFNLHQHFSLLGLIFAMFHGLILMGDRYLQFSLGHVLMPFASTDYRPVWVGLGQLAFYLMAMVVLSFYFRRWLTPRGWRLTHLLGFMVYALALLHAVFSGTDAGTGLVKGLYWGSSGILLFLFIFRVLNAVIKPRPKEVKQPA